MSRTSGAEMCVCDSRYAECEHPNPCPSPSARTHGPWCGPCNAARLAHIGASLGTLEKIAVRVKQAIEWEIVLDPSDPQWDWLLDRWHDSDEVVAALDECASETEGPVERAIDHTSPTGAWREVEHG